MDDSFYASRAKLIMIGSVILLLILMGTYYYLNNRKSPKIAVVPTPIAITPSIIFPSPTITRRPEGGPQPDTDTFYVDPQTQKQDEAVGNLLAKLPYNGTHVNLSFSYSTYVYTAIIRQDNREAGNAELDAFLKSNDIEDRSWISNLIIEYK